MSSEVGFCHCGCGNRTEIAKRSRPYLGHVAGEPLKYLRGHYLKTPEQLEAWSEQRRGKLKKNGRAVFNGRPAIYIDDDHPFVEMRVSRRRYVYEHRLVMAEAIGRTLREEEVVHHINGCVTDNRIENLILFSNHSEHMKHHHRKGRKVASHL